MRHFLKETDFSTEELPKLFSTASELKRLRGQDPYRPLEGQSWGMIFYKNSTRTRVSFEVGIQELGGYPIRLDQNSSQIGRGESIADTAGVLGRYLHGLVIRTFGQEIVEEYAQAAGIPVVNALTDYLHPCQIYSDVFTLAEKFGANGADLASLEGKKLVFFGDTASNMANSWLMAGAIFDLEIVLCGPSAYAPEGDIVREISRLKPGEKISFTNDPAEAIQGADIIYTDVWVSMGDEENEKKRIEEMAPYSVTKKLWEQAHPKSLFLHCMPAHPGHEVTEEVLQSPRAILLDQAENRLHMQKAILASLAERTNRQ